jgi:hypothetical protein
MQFRLATALVVATLSLGCPILDELDASNEQMDKYTASGRKQAEEKKAAAEAAAKDGGKPSGFGAAAQGAGRSAAEVKEAAANWWTNATSLNTDERDPDLVKCQLPTGVEFMRKHDCLMRSGLASK